MTDGPTLLLLCSLGEGKVESIDESVCYTLHDIKHVLLRSDVVIGSRAKSAVDKIICEGWDRVLYCQVKNSDNVSYLLDLRKSCLASQICQGALRSPFTLEYLIPCTTLRSWV